ncbi:MAG: carbohydrate ABC transporter permease [Candidatus Caldatribacteriaceae bacterium]
MKRKGSNLGVYVFLMILSFFFLFPVLTSIVTAFRTQQDVVSRGFFSLPSKITLSNFPQALRQGNFKVTYRNSLLITFVKVPLGIFVAAMAAYPLAKFRFQLREPLFILFLLGMGIPVNVTLLPLTIILRGLKMLDRLWGLLFPYIVFGLPFQILICRGFFRGIPDELIDSARIDGCSEFRVFWKILLPLSGPAIAALFIIDFLATWNEFLMALIFIHSNEWKTVPLGLMAFQGQFGSSFPLINAGVLISILPVLAVYILLQRYFVSGITAGALKE